MSSLFGGDQPVFQAPAAVAVPPPATEIAAAPVAEVKSGAQAAANADPVATRKLYRPASGIGSTGTGLSV